MLNSFHDKGKVKKRKKAQLSQTPHIKHHTHTSHIKNIQNQHAFFRLQMFIHNRIAHPPTRCMNFDADRKNTGDPSRKTPSIPADDNLRAGVLDSE